VQTKVAGSFSFLSCLLLFAMSWFNIPNIGGSPFVFFVVLFFRAFFQRLMGSLIRLFGMFPIYCWFSLSFVWGHAWLSVFAFLFFSLSLSSDSFFPARFLLAQCIVTFWSGLKRRRGEEGV